MNDRSNQWVARTDAACDAFRAGDRGALALTAVCFELLMDTIDGTNVWKDNHALCGGLRTGALSSRA